MRYIDVVIDNKSEYTDSFFTYKAQDDIAVGDKVYVPFANRTKSSEGYVVKIDTLPKLDENKIKAVSGVDRDRSLTSEIIDTAIWMIEIRSQVYRCNQNVCCWRKADSGYIAGCR